MRKILIAGGDMRQVRLAAMLKEKGYSVHTVGLEKAGLISEAPDTADWVFLPVPYQTPDGEIKAPLSEKRLSVEDITYKYPSSAYLLGGSDARTSALLAGRRVFDVLSDEAFLVYNAMLTAQGAVCAYLKESGKALYGARCVVTGWGRISKLLCGLLKAHAAHVTAAARKPGDLEMIRAEGLTSAHISELSRAVKDADVVFNTVPARIFGDEELKSIPAGARVIELASPPYGLDVPRAKEMGIDARIEAGLPGRYFPASAAEAMLCAFEREEGYRGTER
jgi:dipicolinate synthase subunit A